MNIIKNAILNKTYRISKRYWSTNKAIKDVSIDKIRNIGILAHIDAGKTTTTERMLYYSGLINHMGEVHHGNTVTDYMDQERERGITISSAAITFHWRQNQFNLIDTPGHIDFTMEVEQTLNVLDGAIIILDASAGVEAQSVTVTKQAQRYKKPFIFYLNKMDRPDGNVDMCISSIENKLDVPAVLTQRPIYDKGKFVGIMDLISIEKVTFNDKIVNRTVMTEKDDLEFWTQAKGARASLIDKLTSYDDALAETVIASDSLDNIRSEDVVNSIKRLCLAQKLSPVLIGSSYKNIGVQTLMDSIVLYLPSPDLCNKEFELFRDSFCGKAFKIKHDKQKGPLTFCRIYSGSLSKNQRLYSAEQDLTEQCGRIYMAYADEYEEVEQIKNGNIAVITGLKKIKPGSLLTSATAYQRAVKELEKTGNTQTLFEALGTSTQIPEPVFFCSIEPPNLSSQSALETALEQLQREDPSLRVTQNTETGQTVLGGMGELHLEIIRDRILREFKIDADLGPLQIAYRESPVSSIQREEYLLDTKIGTSKQSVRLVMSLLPKTNVKEALKLDKSPESASNIAAIWPKHLKALKQGIEIGLRSGPKISSQVVDVEVVLHFLEVGRGTSESMVSAAGSQLVQRMLKAAGSYVLEPIMSLEVVVPEEMVSLVLADLGKRRSGVENVLVRGLNRVVVGNTPLSELMGYSSTLRTITSGCGSFSMEFLEYRKMSSDEEERAIRSVRGF